jgi:hypothetical protein
MDGFEPIEGVARLFSGFERPWFVSGGWAIDLFVGRVTREHEDLEVGIFRRDQGRLWEHLAGWELCKAVSGPDGGEWVPWVEGEWLGPSIHQVRARRIEGEPSEFELFLNDATGDIWECKRNKAITRPVGEISVRSGGGIPILAPEIQLLYKAKWHRPKDEYDFGIARSRLTPAQREWLKKALEICHAGDRWIAEL